MQNHETQSSITTKCTRSIDVLCEKDYVHFNKVVILCEIDLMIEGQANIYHTYRSMSVTYIPLPQDEDILSNTRVHNIIYNQVINYIQVAPAN